MPEEKKERPKFTLRNGDQVDAKRALAYSERFETMLELRPNKFRALLAIVQNRPEDASPEQVEMLKAEGLLNQDGSAPSDVRSIVLSSYRETREGPVFVNPVRLESEEDKRAVEQTLKEMHLDFLDFLSGPGEGRSPG